MIVLLDTNVLVSAFVATGACADVLTICQERHQLITSVPLLGELRRVLVRKMAVPPGTADAMVALIRRESRVMRPRRLPAPVCRDPDDDRVLAAAAAGHAECVVTGDRDLLELETFRGTPILSPRTFLQIDRDASRSSPR